MRVSHFPKNLKGYCSDDHLRFHLLSAFQKVQMDQPVKSIHTEMFLGVTSYCINSVINKVNEVKNILKLPPPPFVFLFNPANILVPMDFAC